MITKKAKTKQAKRKTSLELFAGCGGLALGTALAGFKHAAVIDWNEGAYQTLLRNKLAKVSHVKDWKIIKGDLATYDLSVYRAKVDFVFGGPPCQPFSLGGKHLGKDDERNMFPHAVRSIREIRPKAFIFENVKGLLRKSFSSYYSYIVAQLRYPDDLIKDGESWNDHWIRLKRLHSEGNKGGLNYEVEFKLLNAANFGIPQKRERVFIMGIRSDLNVKPAFPEPTHSSDSLVFSKWVTNEYWKNHHIPMEKIPKAPKSLKNRINSLRKKGAPSLQAWRTVRDVISDLPNLKPGGTCKKFHNHFFNPGARKYKGHTGSPYDEPAKALKAGDHGVPGGENMLRRENGTVRYFSVRECARLQNFPDTWLLEGAWTEAMRQLGNAVPVTLAEAVATSLRNALSAHL